MRKTEETFTDPRRHPHVPQQDPISPPLPACPASHLQWQGGGFTQGAVGRKRVLWAVRCMRCNGIEELRSPKTDDRAAKEGARSKQSDVTKRKTQQPPRPLPPPPGMAHMGG